MEDNEFPTSYKTATGWKGMDVEVLDELMQRTGLSYKITALPFKRSMIEIQKGRIDLISNLSKNSERSEFMNWLGPIRNTKIGFVVLEKNQNVTIESIDQLLAVLDSRQQQIGYLIGSSYGPLIDSIVRNNTIFREHIWFTPRRKQEVVMLQKDRIFGFFIDEFEANSLINANKSGKKNNFSGFAVHKFSIDHSLDGAYFGASKALDPLILSQLNQAFNEMQNDGTLEIIFNKWSGSSPISNQNKK